MAGGFALLKDVPKTLVYKLSNYRNTISAVIPERIIVRPPSAELRHDQTDQDSLPPYEILDAIMEAYVEHDASRTDIINMGYREQDVVRVTSLIDRNEYKRRQSPIGVRITQRGFGRDRRYPITSKFVFNG
jgi:NAD+ synthetase